MDGMLSIVSNDGSCWKKSENRKSIFQHTLLFFRMLLKSPILSLQVVNIDVQIFESNVRAALPSFHWLDGGRLPPGIGTVGGNPLFLYPVPTGIGVELSHCGCCFRCGLAQILLQQQAILVDKECHHPGIAVFSWIGDEGESTSHLPIDNVVLRAAWRVTTLPRQHVKVIAVERHM